jgi:hypothetical protein
MTNFVEIGEASTKILSLKLDQVWYPIMSSQTLIFNCHLGGRYIYELWHIYICGSEGIPNLSGQCRPKV